jgi:hypothetical protein
MNVFEGMNITGKGVTTISRGRIVWNVRARIHFCILAALTHAFVYAGWTVDSMNVQAYTGHG